MNDTPKNRPWQYYSSTLVALVAVASTASHATERPLPGMTRAASEDIAVQTCRDQAYTLRIAKILDTVRREFSRRFEAPVSSTRFETILFKDSADYRAYLAGRKITEFPDRGAYFPAQKAIFLHFEGTTSQRDLWRASL
jgi:hypothetical protein